MPFYITKTVVDAKIIVKCTMWQTHADNHVTCDLPTIDELRNSAFVLRHISFQLKLHLVSLIKNLKNRTIIFKSSLVFVVLLRYIYTSS